MSMSKGAGGMGFRDLYGFNIALLGKHCWNFLSKPNSLVQGFLKLVISIIRVCLRRQEVVDAVLFGLGCDKLRNY